MRHPLVTSLLIVAALGLSGCAVNSSGENYSQRTLGAQVEDQSIEFKVKGDLERADARFRDARVMVDSYNGIVLLTGQVPSQELQARATEIASRVRQVRQVHNELAVAANLPLSQRATDTWLTTRVRAHLVADASIDAARLRVITENASVYLMGLVTRAEAERIVASVAEVPGIQRIVKAFEYLD
ncbi:BON domain-containing protein [Bisbaumannia pacifica]|uniref:BON domain-containing protein n=1 Tax=Bisbaumannia pacifica TaxID=77098 RepID=A0ABD4L0T8_9GAMM|nr:BON domain-containing protein [Halomonas pacifica]MBH8580315.1 BON domain-containing protein [Halomonas pacifica]